MGCRHCWWLLHPFCGAVSWTPCSPGSFWPFPEPSLCTECGARPQVRLSFFCSLVSSLSAGATSTQFFSLLLEPGSVSCGRFDYLLADVFRLLPAWDPIGCTVDICLLYRFPSSCISDRASFGPRSNIPSSAPLPAWFTDAAQSLMAGFDESPLAGPDFCRVERQDR